MVKSSLPVRRLLKAVCVMNSCTCTLVLSLVHMIWIGYAVATTAPEIFLLIKLQLSQPLSMPMFQLTGSLVFINLKILPFKIRYPDHNLSTQ